jgi:translation initiation factor 3 subunit D
LDRQRTLSAALQSVQRVESKDPTIRALETQFTTASATVGVGLFAGTDGVAPVLSSKAGSASAEAFTIVDHGNIAGNSAFLRVQNQGFRKNNFNRNRSAANALGETSPAAATGNISAQNRHFAKNLSFSQRSRKGWKTWEKQRHLRPDPNAYQQSVQRVASVQVGSDWKQLQQFEFGALNKAALPPRAAKPEAETLTTAGSVSFFNPKINKVQTQSSQPLRRFDKAFYQVTTTDDDVIRELAGSSGGTVFATDQVLALLLTATRSVVPWDIIVHKLGDKIFLDKRDGVETDYVSVNETAPSPPTDEDGPNSAHALAREATFINQNFLQQVLLSEATKPSKKLERDHPFVDDDEDAASAAPVAYRYRKWNLGGGVNLVARTEVDGVSTARDGSLSYLTIRALNEYTDKTSTQWRKVLDTQRGAVLATELKNNRCKLAKWTVQALLAGTDEIKLGYVSRSNFSSPTEHTILGAQTYKTTEFARQINMSETNMWGVLRMLVDAVSPLDSGKYVLMRDPNKTVLRLYSVPEGWGEDSDSDEESE